MLYSHNDTDQVIALIDGALDDYTLSLDAMRWRPTPRDVVGDPDIRVGDVVDYHGSITHQHGECVVIATGDGLSLVNHWYPDVRIERVHRSSVTVTGRWVPICRCGHLYIHPVIGPTGVCPLLGCDCPHHR